MLPFFSCVWAAILVIISSQQSSQGNKEQDLALNFPVYISWECFVVTFNSTLLDSVQSLLPSSGQHKMHQFWSYFLVNCIQNFTLTRLVPGLHHQIVEDMEEREWAAVHEHRHEGFEIYESLSLTAIAEFQQNSHVVKHDFLTFGLLTRLKTYLQTRKYFIFNHLIINHTPKSLQEGSLSISVSIYLLMKVNFEANYLTYCFQLVKKPIIFAPWDIAI